MRLLHPRSIPDRGEIRSRNPIRNRSGDTRGGESLNGSELNPESQANTSAYVLTLQGENPADTLFLHAEVSSDFSTETDPSDKPAARAAPVTDMSEYGAFSVTAYRYQKDQLWNLQTATSHIFNITATQQPDGLWKPFPATEWPGPLWKVRFFAFSPHDNAETQLSTAGKNLALTHSVPTQVERQKDLLIARPVEMQGDANTPIGLSFQHALTGIQFLTGDDMLPGKVSKISLKNVFSKGTCEMKTDALLWKDFAEKKDFSQELSVNLDGTPGAAIADGAKTFMMIPQTCPEGACIEVVFRDKLTNKTRTMTALIGGTAWTPGTLIRYKLSTTSITMAPVLEVTGLDSYNQIDYTYLGGIRDIKVTCCNRISRPGDQNVDMPLPWTAEFSTDQGTTWTSDKPEWLTSFPPFGNGGSPESVQAIVAAQISTTGNSHHENLQAATPVSNYDLSTNGGTTPVNTANCYLVNAPGTYSLPLVYGNSIKNGLTNSSAYTSKAPSTYYVLNPFINHLGAGITDPYIYNNANCAPHDCCLIWQDEPGLITNVALAPDGENLTFEVSRPTIKQGNAIVAVRDAAGTIMWSWHIWVTDYKLGTNLETITNFQRKQYTILPVNLGWCDAETTTYASRKVQVRITQTATGATTQFTINQKENTSSTLGNNPFFQWGRKDPMLPGLRGNADKRFYTDDAQYAFKPTGMAVPIIDPCIQNPHCFNGNTFSPSYLNLWSADNTTADANDNVVIKTVYDPSPAGYCLPPSNAWTGFSTTGVDINSVSEINKTGSWDAGWHFHRGLIFTGETTFFPASGYRDATYGWVSVVDDNGYYWTAIQNTDNGALRLEFSRTHLRPRDGNSNGRSYGFSVRSMQEQ